MAKNTNRNIGIAIGVIVVGIGIGFFILTDEQGLTQITQSTGEVNVILAPPLRLAPTTTTTTEPTVIQPDFIPISLPIGENVVEVGEIFCKIKQSTLVHGINAKLLETIESTGISGSPFIRLAL